jgi:hypothetical protein
VGRFAVTLFLGVLVAALALGAVRIGASRGLTRLNPALAVQLSPGDTEALQSLAVMQMGRGDVGGARATALRAIALEPFHASALRVLGLIDQARGDAAATRRELTAAAGMTWRDTPAHGWLLQDSMARGQIAEALDHADSLLRRSEDVGGNPVTPLLAASAQILPQMVEPLARRLADNPPWRSGVLIRLTSTPGFETGARGVLARLREGPSPPTDQELAPLIANEVMLRQFSQAVADWRAFSRHARSERGALRDGSFRRTPDGTPLMWVYQDNAGASQEQGPAPDLPPGQQALTVQYDGVSTPDLAMQMVVLPPGPHRLTWRERAEEGDAAPLAWEVRCVGGANFLARADPASGEPRTWRIRSLEFTVPASGCEAQSVRLTARPGDRRTSIVMLYTGMSL